MIEIAKLHRFRGETIKIYNLKIILGFFGAISPPILGLFSTFFNSNEGKKYFPEKYSIFTHFNNKTPGNEEKSLFIKSM